MAEGILEQPLSPLCSSWAGCDKPPIWCVVTSRGDAPHPRRENYRAAAVPLSAVITAFPEGSNCCKMQTRPSHRHGHSLFVLCVHLLLNLDPSAHSSPPRFFPCQKTPPASSPSYFPAFHLPPSLAFPWDVSGTPQLSLPSLTCSIFPACTQ